MMPAASSPGALMWKIMMASTKAGILNYLLSFLGLGPVNWLGAMNSAIVSVFIIDTWGNLPFVSLIPTRRAAVAAHRAIRGRPGDGASGWGIFRYITLPLLKPFIILAATFRSHGLAAHLRRHLCRHGWRARRCHDESAHARVFSTPSSGTRWGWGWLTAMVLLILVFPGELHPHGITGSGPPNRHRYE